MGDLAYDAVYGGQNANGLSDQDKNMYVRIYDKMMRTSYQHAEFMRKWPCVIETLRGVLLWHRAVVVENKLNHSSVNYEVKAVDGRVWIKLLSSLAAKYVGEVTPPPVTITDESVSIDSPFRVMLSKYPESSGYLTGEGVSAALRKVWLYIYMQPHALTRHTRFTVEALGRFNNDIVCEVARHVW